MKLIALIVAGMAIFVAVKVSSFYVHKSFEQPMLARLNHVLFKSLITFKYYFGSSGTEVGSLKEGFAMGGSTSRIPADQTEIKATNTVINGVKVRVYTRTEESTVKLPIFVYVHGGGYVFGTTESYDLFLYTIAKKIKMTIVSIDYRMGPEFPYPTPTDDCYKAVQYILEHPEEFNADLSKFIIGGDSAGGNAAIVITQRLKNEQKRLPKMELLIYPWVNLAHLELPSQYEYKPHAFLDEAKIILWYLGIQNITDEMLTAMNSHGTLLHAHEDPVALRESIKNSADVSLISAKYREETDYYTERQIEYPEKLDESHILVHDKEFAAKIKQLFNEDVSPALLSDVKLKGTPATYVLVCEWDTLKDSQLIYAERLRKVGTKVDIDFYNNAFHGIITLDGFKVNDDITNNIIDYIQKNI